MVTIGKIANAAEKNTPRRDAARILLVSRLAPQP
jgi:hypothetical protein